MGMPGVNSALAPRLQQGRLQQGRLQQGRRPEERQRNKRARLNWQSPDTGEAGYDRRMSVIKDRLLGAVGRLAGDAESCSFCGKPADAVKHLVAGPRVMICDDCVAICIAVLAEQDAEWREAARRVLDETGGP
jgi:hypothetical protein